MKQIKEGLTPSKMDQILVKIKPRQVVALVDDDLQTHDLIGRALHDEGYEVSHFKRAEDFLEKISEVKPDAIILEAVLPGMSGLSVLDELRPKNVEDVIPILILSKREDVRAKLLAFQRGAWGYLVKPVAAEEVAVHIRALVRAKILQEMIKLSSVTDPLTRGYNYRLLVTWLEKEIERVKRYGVEASCLLLDVDGFGQINSKCGEKFGDYLLKELADLIRENLRGSDLVGRIQNDEFFVLLPATSKEQAMTVVRRIRRLVQEKEFQWEGKKARPSFCTGIASCRPGETEDLPSFLKKAEGALNKARAVGVCETAVF